MNKKVKIYSPVKEEAGVVMLFSKIHEELGFPKLVSSSARGFDISDIEYVDHLGSHRVTIEFEYLSSNFISHLHQNNMVQDRKYIVICWDDDCILKKTLFRLYQKDIYKVIELKKMVDVLPDVSKSDSMLMNYYLINYKPSKAEYMPLSAWKNVNMFRFNNGNNFFVKTPAKVLIKQGNYIIGGFDVVRFINIKLKNDKDEIALYNNLTDYPVSLFTDVGLDFVDKNIGHIFYNNFYDIEDISVRKSIKELLPNFKITHGAVQKLSKEQYEVLIGER